VAKLLINITHGPEHPTRAALGWLVAKFAVEDGHDVSIFLAGDAVQLLREAVLDNLNGLGTGNLRESYDAVTGGGGRVYASKMSSAMRGLGEVDIEGKPVELVMPKKLLDLSLEADRLFTY
jgi:predicted peroxiredoxin